MLLINSKQVGTRYFGGYSHKFKSLKILTSIVHQCHLFPEKKKMSSPHNETIICPGTFKMNELTIERFLPSFTYYISIYLQNYNDKGDNMLI